MVGQAAWSGGERCTSSTYGGSQPSSEGGPVGERVKLVDAVEKEEGVPVRVHLYRPDSERRTSWEALVANLPPLPAGLPEPRVVQNPGKKRVYLRFEWARLSVDYERDRVLVEAGARWLMRHARL